MLVTPSVILTIVSYSIMHPLTVKYTVALTKYAPPPTSLCVCVCASCSYSACVKVSQLFLPFFDKDLI